MDKPKTNTGGVQMQAGGHHQLWVSLLHTPTQLRALAHLPLHGLVAVIAGRCNKQDVLALVGLTA
jgi:hypothetical protein